MHKAYQPSRPCSNRLLQKRWDEKYYNEHKAKVSFPEHLSELGVVVSCKSLAIEEQHFDFFSKTGFVFFELARVELAT